MVRASAAFHLAAGPAGLLLCRSDEEPGVALERGELNRRLRQGKRLLLARACGVGSDVSVLDAMAGFGLDGLTLARLGGLVTMCEQHPLVFPLLEDGVGRLAPDLLVGGRIVLHRMDVMDQLAAETRYDVVYLDPMFSARGARGKSALPNKRAQYLAEMVGNCGQDLEELLAAARRCARRRVVLKRRRHDPNIGVPHHRLQGRAVRFDVYRPEA